MNASVMDGAGMLVHRQTEIAADRLRESRRVALWQEMLQTGPALIAEAIANGQTMVMLKKLTSEGENGEDLIDVAHRLCLEDDFVEMSFDVEADVTMDDNSVWSDDAYMLKAEWSAEALSRKDRVTSYVDRRWANGQLRMIFVGLFFAALILLPIIGHFW